MRQLIPHKAALPKDKLPEILQQALDIIRQYADDHSWYNGGLGEANQWIGKSDAGYDLAREFLKQVDLYSKKERVRTQWEKLTQVGQA